MATIYNPYIPKVPNNILKQQKMLEGITAGVSGIGSLYAQNQAMQQQADMIQTEVRGPEMVSGKPQFGNIGMRAQEIDAINPQGADGGEIASGAMSGASTGAQIGSIIPGVGTLVGGAIGAIGGALSSIFGGESRESEMIRKKRLAQKNLLQAQKQYNSMMVGYNNNEAARSQYMDMNNTNDRINNLYKYNTYGS